MFALKGQKAIVTGGAGFVGRVLCEKLKSRGVSEIFVPRRSDFDLCKIEDVRRMYDGFKADIVFHLAAEVGGIGANQKHPGRFFYANMAMGVNLIEEGRQRGLRRFVQTGTICAYPKFAPVPFKEESLWDGYPEETNAPYGVAKKALLVMLQSYRAEYGFDGVYALPVNLYGPGDNFHPQSSHVIPALIRKMVEAREKNQAEVEIWGSGKVSREFLYVDDCAEGLALIAEKMADSEPVNLGTGREVTINDLATLVATACGFKGKLRYDASKPDGQPRRQLDTQRAAERVGFRAATSLEEGLKKTVAWYESEKAAGRIREVVYG